MLSLFKFINRNMTFWPCCAKPAVPPALLRVTAGILNKVFKSGVTGGFEKSGEFSGACVF